MVALVELPMVNAADDWAAGAVRAEIARQRISQTALAAEIGVSQQWLNARLVGARPFTVGLLMAVAKCLGRPVSHFLAPLDSDAPGAVAQLAELRTFNPKIPVLRLINNDQPRQVPPPARPHLRVAR